MELQQLRGFLEVAREGSFTRAAARLFVTQPAVSQQVRALEAELGQELVVRGRGGVRLTAAGARLQTRAEQVFAELAAVRQEIDALGRRVTGRVVLATSDTNCTYVLPAVLRRFREGFPEVELDIRNKMSAEVAEMTGADRVDFGLATLPMERRGLRAEPLFERGDTWICPPGHPLARRRSVQPGTAGRFPLLALERGSRSRTLLDEALRRAGVVPAPALELGSIEIIKRFVASGFGVALVPRVAVADEVEQGRLTTVAARGLGVRTVGLVWRRGRAPTPAAAALAQMMRDELSGVRL